MDYAGTPVANGVYFARFTAPGFSENRTLVILK
jgi:hypothetical protein